MSKSRFKNLIIKIKMKNNHIYKVENFYYAKIEDSRWVEIIHPASSGVDARCFLQTLAPHCELLHPAFQNVDNLFANIKDFPELNCSVLGMEDIIPWVDSKTGKFLGIQDAD